MMGAVEPTSSQTWEVSNPEWYTRKQQETDSRPRVVASHPRYIHYSSSGQLVCRLTLEVYPVSLLAPVLVLAQQCP